MIWLHKIIGFIVQHHKAILLAFLAGFICYIVAGVLEAILDAHTDLKVRKKEPMFWCDKHGYFRKQHCLQLFPGMNIDSYACPMCYYHTVFTKPNEKLKVN